MVAACCSSRPESHLVINNRSNMVQHGPTFSTYLHIWADHPDITQLIAQWCPVAYWVSKAMIRVLIMMMEQITLSNSGWVTIRNILEAADLWSKPWPTYSFPLLRDRYQISDIMCLTCVYYLCVCASCRYASVQKMESHWKNHKIPKEKCNLLTQNSLRTQSWRFYFDFLAGDPRPDNNWK